MNLNKNHQHTFNSVLAAALTVPIMFGGFLVFEPTVTNGQNPEEEFIVQQEINEEIAFTVQPQDIIMDTALQGLTGGTSNGSTTFAVTTNSSAGYTVTIRFASTTAMVKEIGSGSIPNLGNTVVDNFNAAAVADSAGFAYTITGPQVVAALQDDGAGSCAGTGVTSPEFCWRLQSDATTSYTFVDSNAPSAGTGDSYDLYFRVVVDQNPTVPLAEGVYTATTTLTAINKS